MLMPLASLFIGILWRNHPPADINGMYGYRTTMSKLNNDTWDYAHRYFSKISLWIGIVSLVLSALLLALIINKNNFEVNVLYLVFGQIAVFSAGIIPTEIALRKHFDNNGNRKS